MSTWLKRGWPDMTERSVGDLSWIRDDTPVGNSDKARVIGGAPVGVFPLAIRDDDHLPGEWWAVHDGTGHVVGYGRLDTSRDGYGDVLLAVAPDRQQRGIGTSSSGSWRMKLPFAVA
jgi:hypothetical protein